MADQWLFKSETYDNCNCAVNCGCQFNLPSTHGYCRSAFVGNIVEGHFNDTLLAGLKWRFTSGPTKSRTGMASARSSSTSGQMKLNGSRLKTIISGEAGASLSNLFSVFASTCSEFCKSLFLPIDLETNFELRLKRPTTSTWKSETETPSRLCRRSRRHRRSSGPPCARRIVRVRAGCAAELAVMPAGVVGEHLPRAIVEPPLGDHAVLDDADRSRARRRPPARACRGRRRDSQDRMDRRYQWLRAIG
jgi:hypothetical protein